MEDINEACNGHPKKCTRIHWLLSCTRLKWKPSKMWNNSMKRKKRKRRKKYLRFIHSLQHNRICVIWLAIKRNIFQRSVKLLWLFLFTLTLTIAIKTHSKTVETMRWKKHTKRNKKLEKKSSIFCGLTMKWIHTKPNQMKIPWAATNVRKIGYRRPKECLGRRSRSETKNKTKK